MTPFSKIYKYTMSLMENNEKIQNMDLDVRLKMLSNLIVMVANVDFTDCQKDLSLVTPYSQQVISETLLIGMQSVDIEIPNGMIIEPYDGILVMCNGEEIKEAIVEVDLENSSVNVTYGDVVLDEYEFQDEDFLEVIFFKDGYFEEDLSQREITILAYGVLAKLIGQEIASEERIKTSISDKDYQTTGRWQTLNSLMEMQNIFKTEFKEYLRNYTYGIATTYEDLM